MDSLKYKGDLDRTEKVRRLAPLFKTLRISYLAAKAVLSIGLEAALTNDIASGEMLNHCKAQTAPPQESLLSRQNWTFGS
jgi:hypothetical protein